MPDEFVVQRAAANLPQSATQTIFSVSGGKVLILGIVGKVTADIQAQLTQLTVWAGATTQKSLIGGVNLSSETAGGSRLIGVSSGTSGALADAVLPGGYAAPTAMDDGGVIQAQSAQSSTGEVAWTLWYRPLEPGAKVAAA